jgi:hypothetical protein
VASSGHTIAWTLYDWGSVSGVVTCHEPQGAVCRSACQGWCDTWRECDYCADTEHLPREGRHCAHCGMDIADTGACEAAEWIENDGADDTYQGPTVPLRDGPIEFTWHGDHLTWAYAEAVDCG